MAIDPPAPPAGNGRSGRGTASILEYLRRATRASPRRSCASRPATAATRSCRS